MIDVIRAFTTAAFAFAAGARDIVPVGTAEEAFNLREQMPGALVMGEVGGRKLEGFDLDNSPSEFVGLDLTGRRLIQRTSAGTQGIVRSRDADIVLAGSLVCASTTADYIRQHAPPKVTLMLTGATRERDGDEDAACADYLEARLWGETPDIGPFVERVRGAMPGIKSAFPGASSIPDIDLEYCTAVDRFDFAMPVLKQGGLLIMSPVRLSTRRNLQ